MIVGIRDGDQERAIAAANRADIETSTVERDLWSVFLIGSDGSTKLNGGRAVASLRNKEVADMVRGIYQSWVEQSIRERALKAVVPQPPEIVKIDLPKDYVELQKLRRHFAWTICSSDELNNLGLIGKYEVIHSVPGPGTRSRMCIWSPWLPPNDKPEEVVVNNYISEMLRKHPKYEGPLVNVIDDDLRRLLVLINWDGSADDNYGLPNSLTVIDDSVGEDDDEIRVWSNRLPPIPHGDKIPTYDWRLFAQR